MRGSQGVDLAGPDSTKSRGARRRARRAAARRRQTRFKLGWGNVLVWALLLLWSVSGRAAHTGHFAECILQGVSVGTAFKLAARSVNDFKQRVRARPANARERSRAMSNISDVVTCRVSILDLCSVNITNQLLLKYGRALMRAP